MISSPLRLYVFFLLSFDIYFLESLLVSLCSDSAEAQKLRSSNIYGDMA